jgi:hypothetical protein
MGDGIIGLLNTLLNYVVMIVYNMCDGVIAIAAG